MAGSVKHNTLADASFSAAGKAAWEAEHTISGVLEDITAGTNITIDKTNPANPIINATGGGGTSDHESLTGLQGGTTGQHVHLTDAEYNYLYGQMPGHTRPFPTVLTKTTDTGGTGTPDYLCLLTIDSGYAPGQILYYDQATFTNGDRIRILNNSGAVLLKNDGVGYLGATVTTLADEAAIVSDFTSNSYPYRVYMAADTECQYLGIAPGTIDYYDITLNTSANLLILQGFLNYMQGQLAWGKVDKTGAVASDVGALSTAQSGHAGVVRIQETDITTHAISTTLYVAVAANTGCFVVNDAITPILNIAAIPADTVALADDVITYIVADYNSGSPIFTTTTDETTINYLTRLPYAEIFKRTGSTNPHTQLTCIRNIGEVESHSHRIFATERYAVESGLDGVAVSALLKTTGNAGLVWTGNYRYSIPAINASTRHFRNEYTTGGGWTVLSQGLNLDFDNTLFNDVNTGYTTMTDGKYGICYYYRGIEDDNHLYQVLGFDQYDNVDLAKAAGLPSTLPAIITSHAVLIARVIYLKGDTTFVVESALGQTFNGSAAVNSHNSLMGLQGGDLADQYYHLNATNYSNVTNAPTFSTTGASSLFLNAAGSYVSVAGGTGGGIANAIQTINGLSNSTISFIGGGAVNIATTTGNQIQITSPVYQAVGDYMSTSERADFASSNYTYAHSHSQYATQSQSTGGASSQVLMGNGGWSSIPTQTASALQVLNGNNLATAFTLTTGTATSNNFASSGATLGLGNFATSNHSHAIVAQGAIAVTNSSTAFTISAPAQTVPTVTINGSTTSGNFVIAGGGAMTTASAQSGVTLGVATTALTQFASQSATATQTTAASSVLYNNGSWGTVGGGTSSGYAIQTATTVAGDSSKVLFGNGRWDTVGGGNVTNNYTGVEQLAFGASTFTSGTVSFVAGANITLTPGAQAVTIAAAGGAAAANRSDVYYPNNWDGMATSASTVISTNVTMRYLKINSPVQFQQLVWPVSIGCGSTTSGTQTLSHFATAVIYSMSASAATATTAVSNNSILTPLVAGTFSTNRTFTSNATASIVGFRSLTFGMTSTLQPGEYWVGFALTTGGWTSNAVTNVIVSNSLPAVFVPWGSSVGTTNGQLQVQGIIAASMSATSNTWATTAVNQLAASWYRANSPLALITP